MNPKVQNLITRFNADKGGAGIGGNNPAAEPGAGATEQSAVVTQNVNSDVEDLRKMVADLQGELGKRETDINRIKSTYDSKQARIQKEYDQRIADLETRFRSTQLEGMDDDARVKFEAEDLKLRNQRLQKQLEEARQEQEAMLQTSRYVDYLENLGIDKSVLDTSSPDALAASAWNAVSAKLKQVDQSAPKTPKTPDIPNSSVTPPPVVTSTGGSPSRVTGLRAIKAAAELDAGKELSDEEVYRRMEMGLIDVNAILKNE